MFQRYLDALTIQALTANSLFQEKLHPDILAGKVFCAIRGGYVDFYYRGGRLFHFQKEFSTHKKYASVIQSQSDYISESDFDRNIRLIRDFTEGYEQIKQNCSLYAGEEAEGVSKVYHTNSFVKQEQEIIVLDIEASFRATEEDRKQDRIDLLLFNQKTRRLRFYEAKHFCNSELWSTVGTRPEVVSQIQRYQTQIVREKDQIIGQYSNYVDRINELFGCDIPAPEAIDEYVPLLAFGFDRDQLQGRIKKLLIEDKSLDGVRYYFVGKISAVNITNMWDAIKCG